MARPKGFDREKVLDRALEVFWDQGYEAASIQDLVDHMGINRGSLYDTFGDKHGLFLAALDRYQELFHTKILDALDRPSSPKKAIERVFESVVRECSCEPGRRGCLLTNSAVELCGHDRDTTERVRQDFSRLEAAFYGALMAAREQGELGHRLEPKELALFLTSSLQGLRVMSKVYPSRSALRDIAKVTLSTLD